MVNMQEKPKNKKLAFFTPLITALGGRGSLSIVPRHPELLQRNCLEKQMSSVLNSILTPDLLFLYIPV